MLWISRKMFALEASGNFHELLKLREEFSLDRTTFGNANLLLSLRRKFSRKDSFSEKILLRNVIMSYRSRVGEVYREFDDMSADCIIGF